MKVERAISPIPPVVITLDYDEAAALNDSIETEFIWADTSIPDTWEELSNLLRRAL